jgi:HEPN domain-containing protein
MPMKTLPLSHYEQWPFARKTVIFLEAAKTSNDIPNRTVGSHEVSYYLLSHAIELAIKAVAQLKTGSPPPKIHDKQELSEMFKEECGFSAEELITIKTLKELNNGSGGLRYDNEPNGDFLPFTFKEGVAIVERLVIENFQD